MAWRDAAAVRLLTRNGHDWSPRYPLIVEAVNALKVRSCLIDGEAIAFEADGLASFELLRGRRHDKQVTLCSFDLLESDGAPSSRQPRTSPLERSIRVDLVAPTAIDARQNWETGYVL
jgi:ATP-dependent DNA ligase